MIIRKFFLWIILCTASLQADCFTEECNRWNWALGTYVWTPWLEQTVYLNGIEADISENLLSLVADSDSWVPIILLGKVDNGQWGLHTHFVYVELNFFDTPTPNPGLTLDIFASNLYWETAGRYRLYSQQGCGSFCILDSYAGVRYTRFGNEVTMSSGPKITKNSV